jgi:hypothetical protein
MPISDRDKRVLTYGGIALAVILVGFVLFNLLAGGGDEGAEPTRRTTSPAQTQPTQTETPTLAPSPILVLPVRDPFSIPPGFTTATTTGTQTGTGSPQPSGTGTGTTPPPTAPTDGSSTTIGGNTVVLLSTFTANGVEQVQVEVDGVVYNPSVGESFGPDDAYELQSVSGDCATFLFGDEAFTLCVSPNK